MADARDPHDFIPLSPVEFEILLVLATGESHGWGIIKEAESRWHGARGFQTGTLYRALRRLTADGLVEPADRRPADDVDGRQRRYFAITAFGRRVAAEEAARLEAQVKAARARDLLAGAGGGDGGVA
ncbi:MAG: PadR family transcriptional regulator [Gemmatimonadota bacterium]|jgi:DNA-binding PadR family transcriptional regulator